MDIGTAKAYTEMLAQFQRQNNPPCTPPAEYILKHGKQYDSRIASRWRGPFKQCYTNAFELSKKRGFTYVEGFAVAIIPTLHAWCINSDGQVVDPTWDNDYGTVDYFGVSFDKATLRGIHKLTGCHGIFDCWQDWDRIIKFLESSK